MVLSVDLQFLLQPIEPELDGVELLHLAPVLSQLSLLGFLPGSQGLELGLRLLAGLGWAPVVLLAAAGVDVQLSEQALEGEAVGAVGSSLEGLEALDLLVGVVVGVRAAGLEGRERGDRVSESLLQGRGGVGRPRLRAAQHVALVGHADGGRLQVADLQAQGEGAEQRGIGRGHALVEPGVPGVVEDALARDLGRDLEAGVEAGLERALSQEGGGEGVDGGDGRALEVGGRRQEALALVLSLRALQGVLDALAQAQLQLAGGLLGEGDRDDAVEGGAAGADEGEDAAHQDRGLAGAGAGLEQERGVEVADHAVADGLVGGRVGHGPTLSRHGGTVGPTWVGSR